MPTDPREVLVRRLFALQQISNTLGDNARLLIRAMFDEIVAEIVRLDPTGIRPRYRQGRLDKLHERVREIAGPAYANVYKDQRAALARIGADQARQTTMQLRAVIGAGNAGKVAPTTGLGPNFFKAVVDAEPVQGALLKDWFADQSRKVQFQVARQVQLGMVNGDTIGDLVRRVRGHSNGRGGFTGGVMQTSTRNAEAIVRTAVNDISNIAHMNTFEANADILAGVTFTATLDSRTSPVCQATDGKSWKLGDPAIQRPPLHVNALASGVRVRTARGDVPVEDVLVGDLAWTHAGRWRRVSGVMGRPCGDSKVLRLQTASGQVIVVTDEHPVLTRGAGWKRADNLNVGDEVFEHREQLAETVAGKVLTLATNQGVLLDSHHRPSEFDQPFVAHPVFVRAAGVSASVEFERHQHTGEGDVNDVRIDEKLGRGINAHLSQDGQNMEFGCRLVHAVALRKRPVHAATDRWAVRRVSLCHAGGVSRRESGGRLGVSGAPMPLSYVGGGDLPQVHGGGCALAANLDPVSPTPAVQHRCANADLPLDGADRYAFPKMALLDEMEDGVRITEVYHKPLLGGWFTSPIISIVGVESNGWVWNISVEDDETFLAEGVVTHNCRSVLIPDVDWAGLGMEPPPEGTRASATGQVPASTTYEEWLKGAPPAVQDDILGPGRAELFRQDRITLKQMVTTDGRRVSLDGLAGRGSDWRADISGATVANQAEANAFRKRFFDRHSGTEADAWGRDIVDWMDSDTDNEAIKADVRAALGGKDNERGGRLAGEVARAGADAPELYRGVGFAGTKKDVLGYYKQGSTHDWTISSFSSQKAVAGDFMSRRVRQIDGVATPTVFRLEAGARAVNVEALSPLWGEREWYTLGRFEVIEVNDLGSLVEVVVRQVSPTWR